MARSTLGVRISGAGRAELDRLCELSGHNLSTVTRVVLGEAMSRKAVMEAVESRLLAMKEQV